MDRAGDLAVLGVDAPGRRIVAAAQLHDLAAGAFGGRVVGESGAPQVSVLPSG